MALPRVLSIAQGSLYEDFENKADWMASEGNVVANTAVGEFKTGTQSIEPVANCGARYPGITKTVYWTLWGPTSQRMSVWFYLHDPIGEYGQALEIRLSNDADFGNVFRVFLTPDQLVSGWNQMVFPLSYFRPVSGSPTWNKPIVRVRLDCHGATDKSPRFSVDDLRFGEVGVPAVLMRFDDGWAEEYTNCFGYMRQFGMRGTLYMIGANIGSEGFCTGQQLGDMDAEGWAVCNHTREP